MSVPEAPTFEPSLLGDYRSSPGTFDELMDAEGQVRALLVSTAHGVASPTAAAATFITRLCTLWFAVAVGLVALALVKVRVDKL